MRASKDERLIGTQWRSRRGAVATVAPQDWTGTKNYCCISDSYYITITFFFLREAFCGLEYAENAFASGASPGGAYDAPQNP